MLQVVLVVLGTAGVAAVFLDAFTTTVNVSAKAGWLTGLPKTTSTRAAEKAR